MSELERPVTRFIVGALVCFAGGLTALDRPKAGSTKRAGGDPMQLGNFSVSLAVKDLTASRAFYEKLGFQKIMGDGRKWLILQNETATLGLFQGMLEKNTLTFNPGWDRSAKTLAKFDDVRDIQKALKGKGIQFAIEADETSTGPASLMIVDPDGNPILLDQHVPRAR
jgi:catechol 2,3-dioxygenase-like lactoylglutathione lyase family enzyme